MSIDWSLGLTGERIARLGSRVQTLWTLEYHLFTGIGNTLTVYKRVSGCSYIKRDSSRLEIQGGFIWLIWFL
jgi:hypothetical protein